MGQLVDFLKIRVIICLIYKSFKNFKLSISQRYSLDGEEVGLRTGLDLVTKRKVVPIIFL